MSDISAFQGTVNNAALPHFLSIQQYSVTFSPFVQSHLRRDREKRVVMFNRNYGITEIEWESKK
jgi:hypothetical protein